MVAYCLQVEVCRAGDLMYSVLLFALFLKYANFERNVRAPHDDDFCRAHRAHDRVVPRLENRLVFRIDNLPALTALLG